MKKKVLSALIATMVVGSVTAMAAPAEIEEGKWDITLGTSFSPNTEDNGYDVDGDSGFYGNVTYGMDDKWAIQYDYAGYVYYGEKYDGDGYHTDGVQIGLQGWYPIADQVNLFGKIGLGNNNQIYEIGAAYKFADDWGLDVSYRWAEYKDVGDVTDLQFDGVRAGISTTF